jgi:hypothetical protein
MGIFVTGRDHYVSQFHLRGFVDPASGGLSDPWLWVGDCNTRAVKRRSPKNLGWSRDLFDGRGLLADSTETIESFLAREVEGPAAAALREFVAGEGPPRSNMRPEVWRYLAWAAARSLPMKALYEAWIDSLPQKENQWRTVEPPPAGFRTSSDYGFISRMEHPVHGVREAIPGECFDSLWDEGWRPRLSRDEFLQIVHLSAWYFQVRIFQRLKWLWARVPAGQDFIIGDRPIVWGFAGNVEAAPHAFRHPDCQFVAPLSRSLALIGHHPAADAPGTVFPSDINYIIASTAHEWIAGPTEAVVRDALSYRVYH